MTLEKAQAEGDGFLYSILYSLNTTKEKIPSNKIQEAEDWVEGHLTPVSGREFFILEEPVNSFYEKYLKDNEEPVSKTFFEKKILKNFRIHHATGAPHCIYCTNSAPEKEKGNGLGLQHHKELAHAQREAFKEQQDLCKQKGGFIIIVQDFSQLSFGNNLCQDLILTVYFKKDASLGHKFYHFISKTTNDVSFVIQVWNQMLSQLLTEYKVKKMQIWSDGGSKHFKTKKHIVWWWEQVTSGQFALEYHFFESYHGFSACDAAASHAKNKIVYVQQSEKKVVNNINEASNIICTLNNHTSKAIEVNHALSNNVIDKKLKEIKSAHKFVFQPKGNILAYEFSRDTTVMHTYLMKKYLPK